MRASVTLTPDLRPELREALDGLRSEMAALRATVKSRPAQFPGEWPFEWGRKAGPGGTPPAKLAEQREMANRLRRLFAMHYELTGKLLVVRNFPGLCLGFQALRLSLASNPVSGVTQGMYEIALVRFASIWPEGAPWPGDIPRPDIPPKTKETCA